MPTAGPDSPLYLLLNNCQTLKHTQCWGMSWPSAAP